MQVICCICMSIVPILGMQLWDCYHSFTKGKLLNLKHNNTKIQRSTKLICFLLNNNKPHCFGAVWDPNEKATIDRKVIQSVICMPTKNYCTSSNIIYWPTLNTTPPAFSYCLWKQQNGFLLLTSITSNRCNKIVLCHTNQPCRASGDTVMIGFSTERNNSLVYGNLNEAYPQVSAGGYNFLCITF